MKSLLIALACAGMLFASSTPKTWENLSQLHAGARIEVATAEHTEKGEFVSFSAENLTIQNGRGQLKFLRIDILRVVSLENSHRARNLLIGAGIGAAVGLIADQTLGAYLRNESNPENARALIWIAPIAAFAGIGAAIPSHPVIYRK